MLFGSSIHVCLHLYPNSKPLKERYQQGESNHKPNE